MNANVPPSNVRLDDIGLPGSRTILVNPKSARHALGGTSFVMRMFGYEGIRREQVNRAMVKHEPP